MSHFNDLEWFIKNHLEWNLSLGKLMIWEFDNSAYIGETNTSTSQPAATGKPAGHTLGRPRRSTLRARDTRGRDAGRQQPPDAPEWLEFKI